MAFKEIENIKDYARQLGASGAEAHMYAKFARIRAVQGVAGQEVVTKMKNGLEETKNVVELDSETKQPGWIVTNPAGEQYIIPDKTFRKKYEMETPDGVFKPKGGVQWFTQVQEDISFKAPWGEQMNIKAGGYLNITNPDDIYGIQPEEFEQTYARCDENGKFLNPELNDAFGAGHCM